MEKKREAQAVGKMGEELAANFLREKGQCIVERNFRYGNCEIDLISIDGKGIHFVEVKTRRPPMMTLPADSVTPIKQRRLVRAARGWLNTRADEATHSMECSFDIVGISFGQDGGTDIEYIQQAFVPIYV